MVSSTLSKLIVGADSMVGAALLRSLGRAALGTSRRPHSPHLPLDLTATPDTWQIPGGVDTAFLCAGITRLAACASDPDGSAQVNVKGMAALAEKLIKDGVFAIFLSSDKVFDGETPLQAPDAPYSPLTEYGRQKAAAEQHILAAGGAVLRLSKILGAENALFSGWINSLRRREIIAPFSDMTLAPVPVSAVVSLLRLVADSRLGGIWQLSGQQDLSYADAARLAAQTINADDQLIQPIRTAESGLISEPTSRYTSLNLDRLRGAFGIEPPSVEWTLKTAFTNPESLTP